MPVVIELLPLWLYMGTGLALVVPFTRHLHRTSVEHHRKTGYRMTDGPIYFAAIGFAATLVWPITGPIYLAAHLLSADERKAEAKKQAEMSLAEAFKIVEAQRQAEKNKHRQQLAEFDRALHANEIPDADWRPRIGAPKKTEAWKDHVRSVAKRDKLYPFDN